MQLPAKLPKKFKNLIQRFMGNHPLPKYYFEVSWGGSSTSFAEVSGLSIANEVIEYREGNSKENNTTKFPGLRKYSNIILKRGIVKDDFELYHWMKNINNDKVERRNIVISLLNENSEPIRVWKIYNAWPCKLETPDLKATGNEVAMETIELVHEGLEISS